jgi:antitoxin HicB
MGKTVTSRVYRYTAVFEPDPENGGFTATVPALPGCISEGETFEQAVENIKEAAALYLEVMKSRGEELAEQEDGVIVALIQVAV